MRSGASEIRIKPANGWLISTIRKIAAEADSAKMIKIVMRVALKRVKRLKLAKMMASQKISTAKNGWELSFLSARTTTAALVPDLC